MCIRSLLGAWYASRNFRRILVWLAGGFKGTDGYQSTVEPVILHDVCQETFDAVRQVHAVRREILALTAKFATGLLCSFAEYALTWDAKS